MRKLIVIFLLLSIPFYSLGQTLIDYCANPSGFINLYNGNYTRYAQSFTNTNSNILYSAKFNLRKTGAPTGNIYTKLYTHSGTYGTSSLPTGAALATSDALDISVLTTSNLDYEFIFSGANKISLSGTTYYCVSVEYTGGDASNYLTVFTSSGTHSGNPSRYFTSWTTRVSDFIFYVYGDATVSDSPHQILLY